jgi:hypothetical protein
VSSTRSSRTSACVDGTGAGRGVEGRRECNGRCMPPVRPRAKKRGEERKREEEDGVCECLEDEKSQ